jgi:hypothetical protein
MTLKHLPCLIFSLSPQGGGEREVKRYAIALGTNLHYIDTNASLE